LEEDEKPSFSDGEEESQPVPQYEDGDDGDVDSVQDEDDDVATFADTVQALQVCGWLRSMLFKADSFVWSNHAFHPSNQPLLRKPMSF
jgi:hypothetical protein